MIISIDAEKAFENIQHPFMMKTLQKIGIEGTCLNIIKAQWFSIIPDFSLELQGGLHLESQPYPDPHTPLVDPTTHLSFNLLLSKKKREARDSLTLPFQFSSEKQQALLRPGLRRATSHIF